MKEEKKEKRFQLKQPTVEEDSDVELRGKDDHEPQTFFHNNAIDDDKILNKE